MSNKNYFSKSEVYENFLKKAYNNQVTFRHGVDKEFMKLLMEAERGIINPNSNVSYKRQLQKVKNYILLAIEKMLVTDLEPEIRSRLNNIKRKTTAAQSSAQLLNLCSEGIEATKELALSDQ